MTTTQLPANVIATLERLTDPDTIALNRAIDELENAASWLVDKEDLDKLTADHKAELSLAYDAVHEALEAVNEILLRRTTP